MSDATYQRFLELDAAHLEPLPFPSDFDESALSELIGAVPSMDLSTGIRETMSVFRSAPPHLLPVENRS